MNVPAMDTVDTLVEQLTGAWGSWGPNMTPNADRVAFISDRHGVPQLWVQDVVLHGPLPQPTPITSVRRPGDRRPLVGGRVLAGVLGGTGRRRPHPGVGGPPRRHGRPAGRRSG